MLRGSLYGVLRLLLMVSLDTYTVLSANGRVSRGDGRQEGGGPQRAG